jgi:hypothetical protein
MSRTAEVFAPLLATELINSLISIKIKFLRSACKNMNTSLLKYNGQSELQHI